MITLENTKTIYDLVKNAGKEYGDKVFLRYEEENGSIKERSYKDFAKDCSAFSSWMDEKNICQGHKMHAALLGRGSHYYMAALLGITGAGSVSIPLDVQLSKEGLVDNILRSDTEVIFYDWEFKSQIEIIKEKCPNVKYYVCIQNRNHSECAENIINNYREKEFISKAEPEECAIIIFTSGTTGRGKGVMLSHRNLIDNTFCSTEKECQIEEVFLNVLPMHHIFCLNGDVFLVMRYGSTLCLGGNNLSKLMYYVKLFEPSVIRSVPMMAKALYNKVLMTSKSNPEMPIEEVKKSILGKRLHKIVSGGGYLPESLALNFLKLNITIGQGYGMSECSPKVSVPDYSRTDKLNSVGQAVDRCEIRIVDGEIQVKSPSVMMGYYKEPDKTAEVITEDGWLRTGDLGYLDDDNFLYLTGRKKNLIVLSNGENVSPEGIENHFDGETLISDILVYGNGDVIAAEIYPNYKYAEAEGIEDIEEEIQKIVNKHNAELPSYEKIVQCTVRKDPFEKTSSKKIMRQKYFNKKNEEEIKAVNARKPENDIQKKIYDSIAEIIGNELFGIDSNIYDCGMDSLGSVMLIEELNNKFKKTMTFNDLMENNTVLKIEKFIENAKNINDIDLSIRKEYPITPMQKYFAYIIKGNTTANLPFTFKLDNSVDLNKLKKAIEDTIEAHPGLKAIIKPDGMIYKAYRDDSRNIDIPIIKLSEEEWQTRLKELLVPFAYTAEDNLFHIYLFETETSKYMFFDVAHIMGDGITMNILFEDVNKFYCGEPVEKESYTFYEYMLEIEDKEKKGMRERDIEYIDKLMKDLKMKRSILNKKEKEDYSDGTNAVIRKRFESLSRKEILYFCRQNSVSENVLFITAYNYCISLFSDEKDVFCTSIHSGRTDNRWTRLAGPLFLTYYCRYNQVPHERVTDLLHKCGKQIMETMRCYIAAPREGEMFFQYQGDILNINEIGGAKAEKIRLQLDSLPFHMQVMSDDKGYYTELRYWKNRFDKNQLEIFLICYESVLSAMLEERSVRRLKKHIPETVYPKHFYINAGAINDEAGYKMISHAKEDEKIKVYVLDENYNKKPYGAWGVLYIMDYKPSYYGEVIENPYGPGTLYCTTESARILPDGSVSFLKNSGRTVLTDGSRGRIYYELGFLESVLLEYDGIDYAECYMNYDREINEMTLTAEIKGNINPDYEELKKFIGEKCPKHLIPKNIKYVGRY